MMNGQHVLDAPSYGESKKDKVLNRQNNVRDALKTIADGTIYKGEPLGENFSDDGLTNSATEYNLNNVAGFNDGGTLILKRHKRNVMPCAQNNPAEE